MARSSSEPATISNTECGAVIRQGIKVETAYTTFDEMQYVDQQLDSEVGYNFIKWLRERGFPKVWVKAEYAEATTSNPTSRLELTVRLDGTARDVAPGAE